jgi:hypothetical protein
VAKSTDGGCTYPTAAKVSGTAPAIFDDKVAIAADANAASPFRDNVYGAWTSLGPGPNFLVDQILFARSTDGGTTWSNPQPLSPANAPDGTIRQGSAVKVGPDGTVYVVWADRFFGTPGFPASKSGHPATLRMAISRNGGRSFPDRGVVVAAVTDDGVDPLPGASFRDLARIYPSLAIAPDGTLYVAWCNHTNGHSVVLVTKSADGLTWSAPPVKAGDVSGRSAFFASVTVDPDGLVDVVFQALDDQPPGTAPGADVAFYDSYFAQSTDQGTSFGSPLKISTASSDPDGSSLNSLRGQFLGDYITAVADSRGGGLFAVWTDSRNASPCTAVDDFRAGTADKPNVITDCPTGFGNTDIFLGTVDY